MNEPATSPTPAPAPASANFEWRTAQEYLVYALGIAWRRWRLAVAPIVVAAALGALAVHFASTTYTARSLILLRSANRGMDGAQAVVAKQIASDQISAIDAWLKSDQVLYELLPKLTDERNLQTEGGISAAMRSVRQALTLELVGGSAVEVRFTGNTAKGLAEKLETIVVRLMEGLTGPDRSILSARQLILLHTRQDASFAERRLTERITRVTGAPTATTFETLAKISDLHHSEAEPPSPEIEEQLRKMRLQISENAAAVADLEALYAIYRTAAQKLDALQQDAPATPSNYVGMFDDPENLLIVGRPKDPIFGESPAKKIAIAGILLGALAGLAIALIAELLERRLNTEHQFTRATGLPVVARLPAEPRTTSAPAVRRWFGWAIPGRRRAA